MSKVNDFVKKNKILVILGVIVVVVLVAGSIYFAVAKTNSKTNGNIKEQQVSVEDIEILEDKGIITGIKNMEITKGTKVSFKDLVTIDNDYVKSIDVDDSQVDYDKEGKYKVIYTITFDKEKLQAFLKDENIEVPFDMEGDSIIINVSINVTVTDNADNSEIDGETTTNDTKNHTPEENQNAANNHSSSSNSGSNSSGNNNSSGSNNSSSNSNASGSQPGHQHTWVTRTETVQEPVTVIVNTKKQEYTLYKIYWYNTNQWEDTRDPNRFKEWERSADGGLYKVYHSNDTPESNPLFLGYDSNGNPTYANDHSIVSGLYEEVPCEPYEKTEMQEVTITVEVCSQCGAVKGN